MEDEGRRKYLGGWGQNFKSSERRRGGRRRGGGVGSERRSNTRGEKANGEVEASVGGVEKDMKTKCKNGE